MKPKYHTTSLRNSSNGVPLVTAIVVSFSLSAANAADWTGGTSTDWNTPTNWSGGLIPKHPFPTKSVPEFGEV